jgi:methionyl-tRNA formyltransferase
LKQPEEITFTPQDKSAIKVYPQRKPEDGEINPEWPARKIYDFIRAQAPPYPGAFIRTTDGKKIIIERARLSD